jgi:hypothetical protein
MKRFKDPMPGMAMVRRVDDERPQLGWGIYLETMDGGKRVDLWPCGGVWMPIGFRTKKSAAAALEEIGMLIYPPGPDEHERIFEICTRLTDKTEMMYLRNKETT